MYIPREKEEGSGTPTRFPATMCDKALEISPGYELAKRNMKILNNATQKDIERMAKEYRVMMVNKDKEMEIPRRCEQSRLNKDLEGLENAE